VTHQSSTRLILRCTSRSNVSDGTRFSPFAWLWPLRSLPLSPEIFLLTLSALSPCLLKPPGHVGAIEMHQGLSPQRFPGRFLLPAGLLL